MKEKEAEEVKVTPKKSSEKFIALVGFNTSDDKRFEAGDAVSGLKQSDIDALVEMGAIAKEK